MSKPTPGGGANPGRCRPAANEVRRAPRALVTGATGLIGRHVPAALAARGFEVHAAGRSPAPSAVEGLSAWHNFDLLDPHAATTLIEATRPSHLVHLAWVTAPGEFHESGLNDRWLDASRTLLEAFASGGGRRFVGAGSCAEYDWTAPAPFSEATTPLRPVTRYGIAKDALRQFADEHAAAGGPTAAWGRIFLLHGEHEHPRRLVPSIVRALLEGRPAASGPVHRRLDLLHAADVARGLAAVLDSEITGAVNVASGQGITVGELLERLGALAGNAELLRPGVLEGRPGEPDALVADTRRIAQEVGWSPTLGLAAGLQRSVAWWRARAG